MVFEDSSKTVLKDCVQRLFNYCPQRQCSNALFKDLVQRCFSTTSLYLHVFSFFPFVIPFFTHSFFSPSLRCEKEPLSDTGQISIQDKYKIIAKKGWVWTFIFTTALLCYTIYAMLCLCTCARIRAL